MNEKFEAIPQIFYLLCWAEMLEMLEMLLYLYLASVL